MYLQAECPQNWYKIFVYIDSSIRFKPRKIFELCHIKYSDDYHVNVRHINEYFIWAIKNILFVCEIYFARTSTNIRSEKYNSSL